MRATTLRPTAADLARAAAAAPTSLRRHMLSMARGQGQGYIGQGLGIADLLAALYFHELRYDPDEPRLAGARPLPALDRPLLDRALGGARRGRDPAGRRARRPTAPTTAASRCRTLDTTPGVEMIGGSLGHGLGQGVGQALGLRLDGSDGARLRRALRRRDAGGLDLGGGDVGRPLRPRRPRRADRLQRHPGRRPDRPRHGAGRRQVARLRLGDAARSTATTWPRSSARSASPAPATGRPKAIVLRTLPGKGVPTHRGAARRRTSSASIPASGTRSSPSSKRERRRPMAEPGRTLAMGQDEATAAAAPTVDAPFGQALVGARRATRPEIVGLTADLGKYTDILPFRDAFPDRFFNVGMAEQNLVAVAAGLARTGKIRLRHHLRRLRHAAAPTTSSPSPSPTAGLNVKIIAGLPGLTTGYGGTHQAIEDLALMRMIPGLVVIDPCDATEIAAGDRGDRRPSTARSTCGSCAARCRWSSTPALPLRDRQGAAAPRGQRRRHHLDRPDDRARARRRGRARRRAASPPACCTCRRSSRSTPTPSPTSPPRSTALVTAENHVVVGGLASLVVEALFERGICSR